MGATTFIAGTTTEADINAAFMKLRTEAKHLHGHAGYTGSIAEKDHYEIITAKPVTRDAAGDLARKLIADDDPRISDKHGPAGAIALKDGPRHRKVTGWLFFGWASE